MGQLDQFELLNWEETKPYSELVRKLGILQLIEILKVKGSPATDFKSDRLLWGDEMEYYLIEYNHAQTKVSLSTSAYQLLTKLQVEEEEGLQYNLDFDSCWRPEYAKFMLEGTPGKPYSDSVEALFSVQPNMELRRKKVLDLVLNPNQKLISMSAFPRLGCSGSVDFNYQKVVEQESECTGSIILSDAIINPNPRYLNLAKNLTERSGHRIQVQVPIFKDKFTCNPFFDGGADGLIHFDGLSIGTSCCCLQTTFQAKDMEQARYLYDSLIPLAPILLALSANSPMFKGYLSDVDCRWNLLVQACDERTSAEKDCNQQRYLSKSRYASSSHYLSNHPHFQPKYNDLSLPTHQPSYTTLMENGIDQQLAQHFGYLFIRDPLTIPTSILTSSKLQLQPDKTLNNQHFENVQSSNWTSIRFKPPPTNSDIGFRVEFRTLEVQLTDFENAAYAILMNLIVRTILHFELNLFMPISQVDRNMELAQLRDAVNTQLFKFRKHINHKLDQDEVAEMDLDTILNGSKDKFVGLIPLINRYLHETHQDLKTVEKLQPYLNFIQDRANGKLQTGAQFLRSFVHEHPNYCNDSKVQEPIQYELIQLIDQISNEKRYPLAKRLVGDYPQQVQDFNSDSEPTTDTDTDTLDLGLNPFTLESLNLHHKQNKGVENQSILSL